MTARLSIVATPIGNLNDLSPRAADTLAQADLILCEDTRHTAGLLRHLGLHKPTWSLHAHNEEQQIPGVLDRLAQGQRVAVVSDAGTPCLSDPGARLVDAVHAAGFAVETLPGPFAAGAALAASGLLPVPFAFWGFLAKRGKERQGQLRDRLQPGPDGPMTHAFYVPGRDLREFAEDLALVAPTTRAVAARELTKLHEGYLRAQAKDLPALLQDEHLRGEAVVLVEVHEPPGGTVTVDPAERVRQARAQGLDRKQALRDLAKETGLSRKALYELWIAAGGGDEAAEPEA